MSENGSARGSGGVAWGFALAVAAAPTIYAVVRWIESRTNREPDPSAVIWAEHSALLTRTWLTAYVLAGVVTACVAVTSRWPSIRVRAVETTLLVSALALVVQVGLLP